MILFHAVRFQNFLSFGNDMTEILLDRSPTTLITGENGAGKSTFLDALTFVLYNKPFRKINKPQLVNSVNKKGLLVELEFSIGSKFYLVRRGIKPNVFEIYESNSYDGIDDESNLLPQDAKSGDYQTTLEKHILKMNYQAFTQVVILGKATFVPFMRLSASDRRSVIEDLLGLRIFGTMNTVLKDKLKNLKSNISEAEHTIDKLRDRIDVRQRYIDQVSNDNEARITELHGRIGELESLNKEHSVTLTKLNDTRATLMDDVSGRMSYETKKQKLNALAVQLSTKRTTHEKTIAFFNDNDNCPTCTQPITESVRNDKVTERQTKINKIQEGEAQIQKDIADIEESLESIYQTQRKINDIDTEIGKLSQIIATQSRQINQFNSDIKSLNKKSTEDDQQLVDELTTQLDGVIKTRNELLETGSYYQNIGVMLKDTGIKTLIINKYLPIFNNLINTYLQKMGFIVKFTLDEQFNEHILSRYRDKFSYNNFSEGQKLRIDLAILMTWREIAKLKNSLSTNLLIMDEVFDSSLDQDGVDAFMDILPSLGDSNIFVISHTPEKLYDKFRSQIHFTNEQNFSSIAA